MCALLCVYRFQGQWRGGGGGGDFRGSGEEVEVVEVQEYVGDPAYDTATTQLQGMYTVKPPKRGHFGTVAFVLSSEVVLLSEVAPFLLLNPIQCVRNVF